LNAFQRGSIQILKTTKECGCLTDVTSTRIRKRVAGYVTKLAKTSTYQNSVEIIKDEK
jgi:ribosomal protein S17E